MTLGHKRFSERALNKREETRDKKKIYFAAYFLSDQQTSDYVSQLTNRWIKIKFELRLPDILVVDLNSGDWISDICKIISFGSEQLLCLGGACIKFVEALYL